MTKIQRKTCLEAVAETVVQTLGSSTIWTSVSLNLTVFAMHTLPFDCSALFVKSPCCCPTLLAAYCDMFDRIQMPVMILLTMTQTLGLIMHMTS